MQVNKTFRAIALSGLFPGYTAPKAAGLLLAGVVAAAPAQESLVSGAPHPEFFGSVPSEAEGPVTADIVGHGEGDSSKVVRKTIRIGAENGVELTEVHPEAFIGLPVEVEGADTTIAEAK